MRIFLLLIVCGPMLWAQTISNVDLDDVRLQTKDESSAFFYQKLTERLYAFDTTLTEIEMVYLYYGIAFQPGYMPYGSSDELRAAQGKFKNEDFEGAISPAKKAWDKDPVSLKALYYLMIGHMAVEDTISAFQYGRWYYGFLDIIYGSGDGLSESTAFVVNRVEDEYTILRDLGLGITKQGLQNSTDVMTLREPIPHPEKPGHEIDALYFNVHLPLNHLNNMFSDDDSDKKSKRKKKDKKNKWKKKKSGE